MIHTEHVESVQQLLQNEIIKEYMKKKEPSSFFIPTDEIPVSIVNVISQWLNVIPQHLPIRIFKGDTAEHVDRGDRAFEHTCILYLSVVAENEGVLEVGGVEYPIGEGDMFVFKEGTPHETHNMGETLRVSLGPFNEYGLPVGAPGIQYYTDSTFETPIEFQLYSGGEPFLVRDSSILPSIPENSVLVGWYVVNDGGTYSIGQIILAGSPFSFIEYYNVYPIFANASPSAPPFFGAMRLSNNASVSYYKQGSLSLGGSTTVRNSRAKSRRT